MRFKAIMVGIFAGYAFIAYCIERFLVPWIDGSYQKKRERKRSNAKISDLNFV